MTEHPSVASEPEDISAADRPFAENPLSAAAEALRRLRSLGAWEREQTHASLLRYLIEETYELVDVIDAAESAPLDRAALRSELADLLLQVLFHAAIAGEDTAGVAASSASCVLPCAAEDVAEELLAKLRRRAPHFFDGTAEDAAAALTVEEQDRRWQASKASTRTSCTDGLPRSAPALVLTEELLRRARRAGVPDDLLPAELWSVIVDPDELGAELRQRRAVLDAADRIRAAGW